ncbi:MAG: hypothetical protein KA149_06065 [Chitinophagales bacterium]|nr:hypothetical protein [Chitinophagales bacterium]
MKARLILFPFLLCALGFCSSYAQNSQWQRGFNLAHSPVKDSVWGKPVKFYISNKKCSPLAIAFYYGTFRPTDNDSTEKLLALITTSDTSLRPFYRWVLSKTIQIQDGALGEYTGIPARRYAEVFPIEFFTYMDSDKTGNRYKAWVDAISYSGYYQVENTNQKNKNTLRQNMIANCINCNRSTIKNIEKFVGDCFNYSE